MKLKNVLILLFIIIGSPQNILSQYSFLNITPCNPEAGKKVTISYNGPLAKENRTKISCIFLSTVTDDLIEKTVPTRIVGNKLIGTIEIPKEASYVHVAIRKIDLFDNNDGEGYGFNIYKRNSPVKGTFFSQGYSMLCNEIFCNGYVDAEKALKLINKEFERNPDLSNKYRKQHLEALFKLDPDNKNTIDLANKYLNNIINTGNDEENALDYIQIIAKNNQQKRDSLTDLIVKLIPFGYTSFTLDKWKLYESSINRPDSSIYLYNLILNKYTKINSDQYGDITERILSIYSERLDYANFDKLIRKLSKKDKSYHPKLLVAWLNNSMAEKIHFNEHGNLSLAKKYSKKSLKIYRKTDKLSDNYGRALGTYATILSKQGKRRSALSNFKKSTELTDFSQDNINELYIMCLIDDRSYSKVIEIYKDILKNNSSNKTIDSLAYVAIDNIKCNKSIVSSLPIKINQLKVEANIKLQNQLKAKMVDKSAPNFTLTDMQNNPVDLSNFSGKIVILDFWATWCTPCLRSFPAMQKAIHSMKDKPVEFLFINTFEDEEEDKILKKIEKEIGEKGYNFKVLLDSPKSSVVAKAYGVNMIPTKIFIDTHGNIRYISEGFESEEKLLKEIDAIVQILSDEK